MYLIPYILMVVIGSAGVGWLITFVVMTIRRGNVDR